MEVKTWPFVTDGGTKAFRQVGWKEHIWNLLTMDNPRAAQDLIFRIAIPVAAN